MNTPPASDLLFPYMFWAHGEGFAPPFCLSQSGMPPPEASFLGTLTGADVLAFPAEALRELEERIARLFRVDPERVLVTLGASAAMHLAALRWFRPGTRVLHEIPSYEPFRALPRYLGAEPVPIERPTAAAWQVDPDEVEQAARAAAGPAHLFLTNPHNPTGAVLGEARVRALAASVERTGGVLVSCEVYMEYATDAQRVHAALVAPNAVSIGSLTKAYGLGSLRIGWMLLGEGLIAERPRLVDLAYLVYLDPPTASLRAACVALDHLDELVRPLRAIEATSRPHLVRWLRETSGIEAHVPDFGIIAFPRVAGVTDTRALARFLADEFGVAVVPGEFFGRPGHVRVGCGVPEGTLVEGLVRLGDGIRAFLERSAG